MPMVNLSLENLGQATERHYALVRYQGTSEPRVSLLRWMGKPKLAEDVTT